MMYIGMYSSFDVVASFEVSSSAGNDSSEVIIISKDWEKDWLDPFLGSNKKKWLTPCLFLVQSMLV